jgi:hypothetical protein
VSAPRLRPAALFPRPDAPSLSVEREHVDGGCPVCSADRLERYPVLRVVGWQRVTRCAACLAIVEALDAPTPFGFTYVPYGSALRPGGDR